MTTNSWPVILFYISLGFVIAGLVSLWQADAQSVWHGIFGFIGVSGLVISLVGYLLSTGSSQKDLSAPSPQTTFFRIKFYFVLAMLAGWIPMVLIGITLSNAADGGSIAGGVIAIGGLIIAIIANTIVLGVSLVTHGFRRMADAYCVVIVIYGAVALLVNNSVSSHFLLFVLAAVTLWIASYRFPARRRQLRYLASCLPIVFLISLPITKPGTRTVSYLAYRLDNPTICQVIQNTALHDNCIMTPPGPSSKKTSLEICELVRERERREACVEMVTRPRRR